MVRARLVRGVVDRSCCGRMLRRVGVQTCRADLLRGGFAQNCFSKLSRVVAVRRRLAKLLCKVVAEMLCEVVARSCCMELLRRVDLQSCCSELVSGVVVRSCCATEPCVFIGYCIRGRCRATLLCKVGVRGCFAMRCYVEFAHEVGADSCC